MRGHGSGLKSGKRGTLLTNFSMITVRRVMPRAATRAGYFPVGNLWMNGP